MGRVMRGVLAAFGDDLYRRLTIRELASVVYGTAEPSINQRRSVLRAVASLEEAGLVHSWLEDIGTRTDDRDYGYRTRTRMPTPGIKVRLASRGHSQTFAAAIAEDHLLSQR